MIARNGISSTKPTDHQDVAKHLRVWVGRCIIEAKRGRKLRTPSIELMIQFSGEVRIGVLAAWSWMSQPKLAKDAWRLLE